jgi:short-subunit dehydrogenase
MSQFTEKYGPWALVTGAAEGLGAEFATQLAMQGINVILADVQIEKAQQQAAHIAEQAKVKTLAVACDLADGDFLLGLQTRLQGIEVGMLVCCAAVGATGSFVETPLEVMQKAVQVNCMATLTLVHHYAPTMLQRGSGGIIIVASNSAYTGAPYIANYAATKAYDLSLAEALWYEFAPQGIDVLGFSPQGTNTPGLRRGMPALKEGEAPKGIMLPEEAVNIALKALGRLPSIRPDLAEAFSQGREKIISAAGDFTRQLAIYRK